MKDVTVKAMILAAGLGTRLRPVTDSIPKALVVCNGKTLLEQSLRHLKVNGINEVIINVHHFAGKIIEYLKVNDNFGLNITLSDESEQLLDTGGGIKKASWFFTGCQAIIVRNVDVISDLDLKDVIRFHVEQLPLATLVVRNRKTARNFLFDKDMTLSGWENLETGASIITRKGNEPLHLFAFSGIQVLDPKIMELITEEGKFSLTEMYLRLAKDHHIKGYVDNNSFWQDAGKP